MIEIAMGIVLGGITLVGLLALANNMAWRHEIHKRKNWRDYQ